MSDNIQVQDSQLDPATYTIPVDDDIWQRLQEHHDLDDVASMSEWDDTRRDLGETNSNSVQGFVAEAVFSKVLDEFNVEHDWGGGAGEADIVVGGYEIDVKSRANRGAYDQDKPVAYRNLLKDYKMGNTDVNGEDKVDYYLHTNVHYSPFNPQDDIVAVEILGLISNEEVEQVGQDVKLYNQDEAKYESQKKEVHPVNLRPIISDGELNMFREFWACEHHFNDEVSKHEKVEDGKMCNAPNCPISDAQYRCQDMEKRYSDP